MGNTPSIYSPEETVPVLRYTLFLERRYTSKQEKAFCYVSKEYGVMISPYNTQNPVSRYDDSFKGVSNERTTIQLKKGILVACRAYLDAKDAITNEIQIHLAVN